MRLATDPTSVKFAGKREHKNLQTSELPGQSPWFSLVFQPAARVPVAAVDGKSKLGSHIGIASAEDRHALREPPS
jgi:hypothetical protein